MPKSNHEVDLYMWKNLRAEQYMVFAKTLPEFLENAFNDPELSYWISSELNPWRIYRITGRITLSTTIKVEGSPLRIVSRRLVPVVAELADVYPTDISVVYGSPQDLDDARTIAEYPTQERLPAPSILHAGRYTFTETAASKPTQINE